MIFCNLKNRFLRTDTTRYANGVYYLQLDRNEKNYNLGVLHIIHQLEVFTSCQLVTSVALTP